MKKATVLFLAALFLAAAGFAQKHHHITAKKTVKAEVAPASVQNAFGENFSNAGDIKWKKTAGGNWDAAFLQDSLQTDAVFTENGSLVTAHTEYTAQNLPAVILNAIKTKYPDATVKDGVKVMPAGTSAYYKVNVDTGGATRNLLVNETGTTVTE